MNNPRTGPMTGIKIVDLSQFVAGPLATQMLAEQGAEVLKIEPPEGELLRLGLRNGFPPLFANDNRGKRCIAIDTKQSAGRDLVLDLVRDADVFVENFRPGVTERLGLDEPSVRAVAPDIVYVSVTGFGPTGPYAERPCLDPIIQGITGMVTGQSSRDLPFPDLIRTLVADKTTAYTAAQAISAALFARERGAGGQHIEIAMLDAVLAWFWPDGMSDFTLPDDPRPPRRASDGYRLTDTADGQIIYYLASTEQICGMWRALGRPELIDDERYNHIGLGADPDALAFVGATIIEEIGKLTTADIIERLARESVPAGPIHDRAAVLTDPQVVHNELIVEWDHPDLGRVRQVRPPVDFHGTPTTMLLEVEDVGASTRSALTDLGRTEEEIADLHDRSIVFSPN
jgi:crotonobetainyl-CoA:carnitine CoA-transferase CaiB-like acyl-CoA transferase